MIAFPEAVHLGIVLIGAFVSVGALAGVLYGVKWKTAAEVAAANADAWEATAKRLAEEIRLLEAKVESLRRRVAELEGLPDLSKLLIEVREHEKRAAARWDGTIEVLAEIRDSLVALKEKA